MLEIATHRKAENDLEILILIIRLKFGQLQIKGACLTIRYNSYVTFKLTLRIR